MKKNLLVAKIAEYQERPERKFLFGTKIFSGATYYPFYTKGQI